MRGRYCLRDTSIIFSGWRPQLTFRSVIQINIIVFRAVSSARPAIAPVLRLVIFNPPRFAKTAKYSRWSLVVLRLFYHIKIAG